MNRFNGKNILLLQGPMSGFFKKLSKELNENGADVLKINFCGGDVLYYPDGINYTKSLENFGEWLKPFLKENTIEMVMLFNDCSIQHKQAIAVLKELGIPVYIFEEGYIRPHFITMERCGINANSLLPRTRSFYENYKLKGEAPKITNAPVFHKTVRSVFWYGLACKATDWFLFPEYKHRRTLSFKEMACFIGFKIKLYTKKADSQKKIDCYLSNNGNRFFVPLQIADDIQITHHSDYLMTEEFIGHTLGAFACGAKKDDAIMFKHHPLDHKNNYTKTINKFIKLYGLQNRVFYVQNGHLPTILRESTATITINSTVGFSSLLHNLPTFSAGRAIYNIDGLSTSYEEIKMDQFFAEPKSFMPSKRAVQGFYEMLIDSTQCQGSFYKNIKCGKGATGIKWPLSIYEPNKHMEFFHNGCVNVASA